MKIFYVFGLLVVATFSQAQVLQVEGVAASGATGHYIRPKGQFIFESNRYDSTSHAIITGHILNSDDEGALEFVVRYNDDVSRQVSADFTRTIDAGFGTGHFPSARVVRAIHVNSGGKGDTTPFAVYDGNSVRFLLGKTNTLPWNKVPMADNMAVFGESHQLQIMPKHSQGFSLIQSYDVDSSQFKPMTINASKVSFGVGNIRIENPSTPPSSSSYCEKGTISWDAGYIYVCVANNYWKRSGLAPW